MMSTRDRRLQCLYVRIESNIEQQHIIYSYQILAQPDDNQVNEIKLIKNCQRSLISICYDDINRI